MELNVNVTVEVLDELELPVLEGALAELAEECGRLEEVVSRVTAPQFKSDIYMAVAALILAEHLGYATKADLASASRLLDFAKGVGNGTIE